MKKIVWIVIIAVAAVVVFFFFKNPSDQWGSPSEETLSPTPTATAKVIKKIVPTPTGGISQTMPYSQLVAEYADRRIQFDERCQPIPIRPTYKNGTKVMFDNRSGDARYIKIGATTYLFEGYDYKILTLSSSVLPATISLSCGAAVNVGSILLQQ